MSTQKITNRPATRKQKEFARIIATEPKTTQTEAYRKAYNVSPTTANTSIMPEASRTLRNPQVQSELAKYTNILENTLINTVKDWGDHERPRQREIAQNAAMYMHDKVHGKAKQVVEQHTTGVTLSIDLTSSLDDAAAA